MSVRTHAACPTDGCDAVLVREYGTRLLLCPSCDAPVATDPNPWPEAPVPPGPNLAERLAVDPDDMAGGCR